MGSGKCPACQKTVTHVLLEQLEAQAMLVPPWRAVAYLCPSCNTVLSVSIDPIALKHDIVAAIKG